ncbi:MAG: hypothetical protein M1823_001936 [Watsoniomyces obsoletus]|nr:MAG: hypothetical protein M1823_001936 [Watsoniomyces obsoletus]
MAQAILDRCTHGTNPDREQEWLEIVVATAHQASNNGHVPIRKEPGKEWRIFKGNKGSRTDDQDEEAAYKKWTEFPVPLYSPLADQASEPLRRVYEAIMYPPANPPTERAWKPKVASEGVQALAGFLGVAALNNIRELVGEGGQVGRALLVSQPHLTDPKVSSEPEVVQDADVEETVRCGRRLRVMEQGGRMSKTDYFLQLLSCFRAYQRMKVNITREKLALHGLELPHGGVLNKDSMTRDLFIHLTHDQTTLEKKGGMRRARDWAKNRMKGARVAQQISDTFGDGWVVLLAPNVPINLYRNFRQDFLERALETMAECLPGLKVLCSKAWKLYSDAAQNPQHPLPDLRLFHLSGDIIDKEGHLSTGFSLVELLEPYQDEDVVNTPLHSRPRNKFGPELAIELADWRRAYWKHEEELRARMAEADRQCAWIKFQAQMEELRRHR